MYDVKSVIRRLKLLLRTISMLTKLMLFQFQMLRGLRLQTDSISLEGTLSDIFCSKLLNSPLLHIWYHIRFNSLLLYREEVLSKEEIINF